MKSSRRGDTIGGIGMGRGFISRGFRGRRREPEGASGRVPPGQYLVDGFPVLSAGPTPRTPLSEWSFSIEGEVDKPKTWSWEEFRALPSEEITRDIHCVTKWSKLGTSWEGVSVDTLLEGIDTAAGYVLAFSDRGYTTNLPLEEVTGDRPGSPTPTRVSRSHQSTAARRACSSPTSTSGRAPNGCAA
jgi:DMSO/TMAO reductase YedYZ molybdopterin-dependent catalytic subunit